MSACSSGRASSSIEGSNERKVASAARPNPAAKAPTHCSRSTTGVLGPLGGVLGELDELQEAAGIAAENALLLFLEQAQHVTVFLHLVPQTFGDLFPGDVHGNGAAGG